MKLDKEQKRKLMGLRGRLFERMEGIIEQRRRIISHLEVGSPVLNPKLAICGIRGLLHF